MIECGCEAKELPGEKKINPGGGWEGEITIWKFEDLKIWKLVHAAGQEEVVHYPAIHRWALHIEHWLLNIFFALLILRAR